MSERFTPKQTGFNSNSHRQSPVNYDYDRYTPPAYTNSDRQRPPPPPPSPPIRTSYQEPRNAPELYHIDGKNDNPESRYDDQSTKLSAPLIKNSFEPAMTNGPEFYHLNAKENHSTPMDTNHPSSPPLIKNSFEPAMTNGPEFYHLNAKENHSTSMDTNHPSSPPIQSAYSLSEKSGPELYHLNLKENNNNDNNNYSSSKNNNNNNNNNNNRNNYDNNNNNNSSNRNNYDNNNNTNRNNYDNNNNNNNTSRNNYDNNNNSNNTNKNNYGNTNNNNYDSTNNNNYDSTSKNNYDNSNKNKYDNNNNSSNFNPPPVLRTHNRISPIPLQTSTNDPKMELYSTKAADQRGQPPPSTIAQPMHNRSKFNDTVASPEPRKIPMYTVTTGNRENQLPIVPFRGQTPPPYITSTKTQPPVKSNPLSTSMDDVQSNIRYIPLSQSKASKSIQRSMMKYRFNDH